MPPSGVTLVPEIWHNICANLTPPSVANLRLASPAFNDIALPWKYKSIRLEAFGPSVERFINIAKTSKLCNLVREITIDTRVDLDWEYLCNESYPFPTSFMNALPYLRYFNKVTALHIRFEQHCGIERQLSDLQIDETYTFRYKVLDTIFHCAAGLWTLKKQLEMDKKLDQDRYMDKDDQKCDYSDQDLEFRGTCLALRELTIANLADYDDPNITSSKAWKTIMALPTLIHFKVFITKEKDDAAPELEVFLPEQYEFFESLPSTWLSPNFAQNLRVLSLYFADYWGWFPILDFRNFGEVSPFPQLKVLALGNYVFTHEWQVDWFSKVGKENGTGGLEELYLDDCPILYHANQRGVCEDGYPDYTVVIENDNIGHEHDFHLRWHDVLAQWKDSMKGLKVFRMGGGSWWLRPDKTYTTISEDPDYANIDERVLDYRLKHNIHRNFAFPAPSEEDTPETWRHGQGLDDKRSTRMLYIEYDCGVGPSPWREKNSDYKSDVFEPEEGTTKKDDVAWDAMITAWKFEIAHSVTADMYLPIKIPVSPFKKWLCTISKDTHNNAQATLIKMAHDEERFEEIYDISHEVEPVNDSDDENPYPESPIISNGGDYLDAESHTITMRPRTSSLLQIYCTSSNCVS
ncbi:f-box protein [Fusarium longipes]|uniref:F-box protein n=1 Tax=Fusarium longipes TaxID=694270 RepID=A0A395SKY7_9HYPO|nr:f-box protein [Fusarium longipes]